MSMIFSKNPTNALGKIPSTILVKVDESFLTKFTNAFLSSETRFLVWNYQRYCLECQHQGKIAHYELKTLGNTVRYCAKP